MCFKSSLQKCKVQHRRRHKHPFRMLCNWQTILHIGLSNVHPLPADEWFYRQIEGSRTLVKQLVDTKHHEPWMDELPNKRGLMEWVDRL